MRKNKLVWVVRVKEHGGDTAELHPRRRPEKIEDGHYGSWWQSDQDDEASTQTQMCYAFFKKATGLSLEVEKPVRVRFSAEIA